MSKAYARCEGLKRFRSVLKNKSKKDESVERRLKCLKVRLVGIREIAS